MNTRILAVVGVIIGGAILVYASYQAVRTTIRSQPKPPKPFTLVDYIGDDTSEVRATAIGPVQANELHSEVTVTVTRTNRTVKASQTYDDAEVLNQNFANNAAAYDDFMRALQNNGFGLKNKSSITSEVGQCSSGTRYVYQLMSKGKEVLRSWSSTCSDTGTFNGSGATVRKLFTSQIPEFQKLTYGIKKLPRL